MDMISGISALILFLLILTLVVVHMRRAKPNKGNEGGSTPYTGSYSDTDF